MHSHSTNTPKCVHSNENDMISSNKTARQYLKLTVFLCCLCFEFYIIDGRGRWCWWWWWALVCFLYKSCRLQQHKHRLNCMAGVMVFGMWLDARLKYNWSRMVFARTKSLLTFIMRDDLFSPVLVHNVRDLQSVLFIVLGYAMVRRVAATSLSLLFRFFGIDSSGDDDDGGGVVCYVRARAKSLVGTAYTHNKWANFCKQNLQWSQMIYK